MFRRLRERRVNEASELKEILDMMLITVTQTHELIQDVKQTYSEFGNRENVFMTEVLQTSNYTLEQENRKLRREVVSQDECIAKLYSQIYQKDAILQQIVTSPEEEETHVRCECCYSTIEDSHVNCSKGHKICVECVNQYCKTVNESINEPSNSIMCLSIHDCDGIVCASALCKAKHGEKMMQNYYLMKADVASLTKPYSREEIEINACFLNADGTFRAFQCSECNYGPLLHAHCNDLLEHHGHAFQNTFVDNRCPRCNTLHDNVADLVRWNGHVASSDGS